MKGAVIRDRGNSSIDVAIKGLTESSARLTQKKIATFIRCPGAGTSHHSGATGKTLTDQDFFLFNCRESSYDCCPMYYQA